MLPSSRLCLVVCSLLLACSPDHLSKLNERPSAPAGSSDLVEQSAVQSFPYGKGRRHMPLSATAATTTPPANAHLSYFGGPVIANVKVVAVYWGANVAAATQSGLPKFFSTLTSSALFGWLNEYNTTLSGGTNQTIGLGSFASAVTITPSSSATTVDDSTIQAELDRQITAGKLPAPDANTVYMTYFPPNVGVTLSGLKSCVDFCAYHGAFKRSSGATFYGVVPDLAANGCNTGCGSGATTFDNLTSASSHELIESVTDPEVSFAAGDASPLAWYDSTNNDEIGDLCNQVQGTIAAADGTTFTVQKEFSNLDNACLVTRPTQTQAPALTTPAPNSVLPGSSATFKWSAGTGYDTYYVNAGSAVDGTNYFSQWIGGSLSATISDLPTDGSAVHLRLWYGTTSGSTATWAGYVDYQFTAATSTVVNAARPPAMTSPAAGSTLTGSVATFDWSAGSGYNQYWLYVGSSQGSSNYFNKGLGAGLSAQVTGLPVNGGQVYARLWYGASSGTTTTWAGYIDYAYKAATFTAPTLLSPSPGSTLSGSTMTFRWSAGGGYNTYVINGGSTVDGTNYFVDWVGGALSDTVRTLPTNGSRVYVRLWYGTTTGSTTIWGGYIDYVFTAL